MQRSHEDPGEVRGLHLQAAPHLVGLGGPGGQGRRDDEERGRAPQVGPQRPGDHREARVPVRRHDSRDGPGAVQGHLGLGLEIAVFEEANLVAAGRKAAEHVAPVRLAHGVAAAELAERVHPHAGERHLRGHAVVQHRPFQLARLDAYAQAVVPYRPAHFDPDVVPAGGHAHAVHDPRAVAPVPGDLAARRLAPAPGLPDRADAVLEGHRRDLDLPVQVGVGQDEVDISLPRSGGVAVGIDDGPRGLGHGERRGGDGHVGERVRGQDVQAAVGPLRRTPEFGVDPDAQVPGNRGVQVEGGRGGILGEGHGPGAPVVPEQGGRERETRLVGPIAVLEIEALGLHDHRAARVQGDLVAALVEGVQDHGRGGRVLGQGDVAVAHVGEARGGRVHGDLQVVRPQAEERRRDGRAVGGAAQEEPGCVRAALGARLPGDHGPAEAAAGHVDRTVGELHRSAREERRAAHHQLDGRSAGDRVQLQSGRFGEVGGRVGR